jgi:hypothetical protein
VARLHFQEVTEIDNRANHGVHIIAALAFRGYDLFQRGVRLDARVALHLRRIFQVVGRQELQQLAADCHRVLIVFRDEVDDAGMHHVRIRSAELLGRHVLARYLLNYLRPGNKHLGLPGLDDEIGERRAIRRSARAGTANQRDLRDRAREHDIRVENLPVAGERIDTLLHARAAGIVYENERRSGFQRLVHDFGDFDRMDLAGRAARHCEILAGKVNQPPADGGRAGHYAVGRQILSGHSEQGGAVLREKPGFFEAVWVNERVDPVARGQLSGLAVFLELVGAAALHHLVAPLMKIRDFVLH